VSLRFFLSLYQPVKPVFGFDTVNTRPTGFGTRFILTFLNDAFESPRKAFVFFKHYLSAGQLTVEASLLNLLSGWRRKQG